MPSDAPLDSAREMAARDRRDLKRVSSSSTTTTNVARAKAGDEARRTNGDGEFRISVNSVEVTSPTSRKDAVARSPSMTSSRTVSSMIAERVTREREDGSTRKVAETIELFEAKSAATPGTPRTRARTEETASPMRAADLERALVGAFERFGSFGRRKGGSSSTGGAGTPASPKMDGTRFAKLVKEVIFAGEDVEKVRLAEIAFAKRAQLARHVDYETFRQLILEDCVEIAGDGATEISTAAKLVGVVPSVGAALSPGKCRFHDDVHAYTGVAAEKHGLDRSTSRRNAGAHATSSVDGDEIDGGGLSDGARAVGGVNVASLPEITGLFSAFESFLQFSPSQAALSLPRWLKVCEDASLYDDDGAFDATSAGIVFKAVSQANRALDFNDFKRVLALASRRADVSYVDFASRVAAAEPVVRSAAADVVSPHRFHDDDSTYTATHRATHRDKVLTPRALSIRKRAESMRASSRDEGGDSASAA